MYQVRIHGRGGQGVVTGAEMLAAAVFAEGKYPQAFPSFGSERMGAPVVSFCRVSDHPIRLKEPIVSPDAIIIQDATLLQSVDIFDGLKSGGLCIINTAKSRESFQNAVPAGVSVYTIDATEIARKVIGRPIPNTVLLGAFCALAHIVSLESLCAAIEHKFGGSVAEKNIAACKEAYNAVSQ